MPIEQHIQPLAEARAAQAKAQTDLLKIGEEEQRLQLQLKQLDRAFNEQRDGRKRDQLNERIRSAQQQKGQAVDRLKAARDKLAELHIAVAPLVDPRSALDKIPAEHPILLFPVRLETRFQFASSQPGTPGELLVRIYPDDVLIDTFEETLSTTELESSRRFWTNWWLAQGDIALRHAAWRELVASVGQGRARYAAHTNFPQNDPVAATDAEPLFQDPATFELRNTAWASQPKVDLLPERFVLVLEKGNDRQEVIGSSVITPLAVGPDPRAPKEKQFQPDENGNLKVPEEQQWLFDFEAALKKGMAFRVSLTAAQIAAGFDRAYVVGVRIGSTTQAAQEALQELITHHHNSSTGFSLIPQGTPTNRTEGDGDDAVWQGDDGFAAFVRMVEGTPAFNTLETDAYSRRDGALLCDSLGIAPDTLQPITGAGLNDMGDARAMNAALWPATMGYWMDTMMNTVFTDEAIGRTRGFFERHVTGRGALPAVRIGDQPYGILPTTAFSRMAFGKKADADDRFVAELHEKLALLREKFWKSRGDNAAHVGQVTDNPQQLLLDILGLHPASVEFHQQWAQSLQEFWNRLTLAPGFDVGAWNAVVSVFAAPALLAELGHTGNKPDLLDKIFTARPHELHGPVIDDRPLSESDPVRDWTGGNGNYMKWLADTAATSLDALRKEEGFLNNTPPNALLYLLLKHALELGLYHSALKYRAAIATPLELKTSSAEKPFIHIEGAPASESRYGALYDRDVRITGDAQLTVADRIVAELDFAPNTQDLKQQITAIHFLEDLSTAQLERLFAEHMDLCTHRLDAWLLGVVRHRLEHMRGRQPTGIVLGAYGYVENLRAKPRPQHKTLGESERRHFGDAPVIDDRTNGGFIHGLSPDHATTAAILRNGHIRNVVPTQPDLLAIDLSSERVRTALGLIEGLRTGQSLGALLGYLFERGLHDRGGTLELDQFIFSIRTAFPLRANKQADTAVDDGAVETVEARHVIDGLDLVEHIRSSGRLEYPWGKNLLRGSAAEENAIDVEVKKMSDALDALADLSLAESVHQLARGNTERAAAAMDMVSKGTYPVQPEVVRTPRSGTALTHRMVLHLDAEVTAPADATPRASLEPALNDWLQRVMPDPANVVIGVERVVKNLDGTETRTHIATVSWTDLKLHAIDLLYMLDLHNEQGMNAIDDRVRHHVYTAGIVAGITPDWDLRLKYTEPVVGKITLFEVAPLVESLRELVLGVKAWSPSEAVIGNDGVASATDGTVDRTKVEDAWSALDSLRTGAIALKDAIEPLIREPINFLDILGPSDPALKPVDAALAAFIKCQTELGAMGVALSGYGGAMDSKRAWFVRIRKNAAEHAARWAAKLTLCEGKITLAANTSLSDFERLELLKEAEAAVSTVFTRTGPLVLGAFETHVVALRDAFNTVLGRLNAVATNTFDRFDDLYAAWENVVNEMDDHDPTVIDLQADRAPIVTLMQDLARQLDGLKDDLQKRLDVSQAKLTESDTMTGKAQCDLRIESAKALFGEDMIILPRYALSAARIAEWSNAVNDIPTRTATASGLGMDRPVDEWLYGVARVRNKAAALENAQIMSDALGGASPVLEPVQFPHVPGEPWLAVQWPADFDINTITERLLYTAIHANGTFNSNPGAQHCGLVLDEWTEVIPAKDEATSIAFHYDRPGTEAPQAWLLVAPASAGTHWNWDDLRATIPDTMQLARMRAMEPVALDNSTINRFLPATIAAVTTRKLTIGVDLARNMKSQKHLTTLLPNG